MKRRMLIPLILLITIFLILEFINIFGVVASVLAFTYINLIFLMYINNYDFLIRKYFIKRYRLEEFIKRYGILLILCSVLILRLILSFQYINNDEASYIYDAKLILEGQIPIKDFVARAIPQIYFYSLFIKVFGTNLYAFKIINTIMSVATVYILYLIGALFGRKISLITATFYAISPIVILISVIISSVTFNVFLVTLGMYLFMKGNGNVHFKRYFLFSGVIFSLAFFVRNISAIYLSFLSLLLFIYAFKKKDKMFINKLFFFMMGAIIPATIILGYFMLNVGVATTYKIFGPGLLLVKEEKSLLISSLKKFVIGSLLSIYLLIPFILFLKNIKSFLKSRYSSINIYSLFVWLLPTSIIYFFYTFKRGFFLSYYYELIPPLCVCSSLLIIKFNESIRKIKNKRLFNNLVIMVILLSLCSMKPYVSPKEGISCSFDPLIGSSVSFKTVTEVSEYIRLNTEPTDEILAGSLQWAIQSNRRQMLDISHPLAYAEGSTVYTLYSTYSREEVINYFRSHDINYVVVDSHFYLAFGYLLDIVKSNYTMVKEMDGIKIYKKIQLINEHQDLFSDNKSR